MKTKSLEFRENKSSLDIETKLKIQQETKNLEVLADESAEGNRRDKARMTSIEKMDRLKES